MQVGADQLDMLVIVPRSAGDVGRQTQDISLPIPEKNIL